MAKMGLLGEKRLAQAQATQMNTSHLLRNNPHSAHPGLERTTLSTGAGGVRGQIPVLFLGGSPGAVGLAPRMTFGRSGHCAGAVFPVFVSTQTGVTLQVLSLTGW